jgi:hypothetical protein
MSFIRISHTIVPLASCENSLYIVKPAACGGGEAPAGGLRPSSPPVGGAGSNHFQRARMGSCPGTTTDAGEAVGGRPEHSADLLRQLDDDPLRAADVAEQIHVFVALHLANELRAVGSQRATTASISSTANVTCRMPGWSPQVGPLRSDVIHGALDNVMRNMRMMSAASSQFVGTESSISPCDVSGCPRGGRLRGRQ